MKIAVGNSRMDKKWKNREISWDELCRKVSVTQRTTETVEEYRKLKKQAGQGRQINGRSCAKVHKPWARWSAGSPGTPARR